MSSWLAQIWKLSHIGWLDSLYFNNRTNDAHMLYVFTNTTFGRAFLETLRDLQAQYPGKIKVILSGKRGWPEGRLRRIRAKAMWEISKRQLVRDMMKTYGVDAAVIEDVNAERFNNTITSLDDAFVAGFNQIFKQKPLSTFRTLVNCHPSLLPLYRGPVPSYWCLHFNEAASGYTFHEITSLIDKGEVIHQEVVEIIEGDSPESLNERISARAAKAFSRYALSLVGMCEFERTEVDAKSIYKHHVDYKTFPP